MAGVSMPVVWVVRIASLALMALIDGGVRAALVKGMAIAWPESLRLDLVPARALAGASVHRCYATLAVPVAKG